MKNQDFLKKIQNEFSLNTVIKLLLIVFLIIGIVVLINYNSKMNDESHYNNRPIKVQIENENEFSAE